ncbi:hypothetical protein [Klebsiella aerogenes]|uniref:hypothetical protein n=1 Tax=Klebsiella aerogenes TaxID=548 RepID=UPI0039C4376D
MVLANPEDWPNYEVRYLYAAPQPAPVVLDAATAIRACLSEFPESARDIVEECADIAENACRSAMLQAEPVTTANKLGNSPSQSPIDHGYRKGCECSGCKTTVRICAELAGNSPVIGTDPASGPDRTVEVRYVAPPGYVMVPKEPTEEMNKAGWAAMNEHDAINPTYRAMLAAAPQEVKP